MGAVEIELPQDRFQLLATLLASVGPNPLPTLAGLGPDRLIAGLNWAPPNAPLTVGLAPPGFVPLPGTLTASAPVIVTHVSTAELDANPAAGTPTLCIGWLQLSAVASPPALTVAIIGIDVPGAQPQRFMPPMPLYTSPIPDLTAAGVTAGAALLLQAGIVTIRFVSSPADNVLAAPRNLLLDRGGTWLIRVTPQLLVANLLQTMNSAPLPSGVTVEDAATASWGPASDGVFQIVGTIGLKKADACKLLVGLSVSITVTATVTPTFTKSSASAPVRDTLSTFLDFQGTVTDWDAFKCWAGGLGLVSLGIGFIDEPIGFFTGVGTLIAVVNDVGSEASKQVASTDLGSGGYQLVRQTDTEAIYVKDQPLPVLPGGTLDDSPVAGPDGIVVGGQVFYFPAIQTPQWYPDAPDLRDEWIDQYNCANSHWSGALTVQSPDVSNTARVAPTANPPGPTFPVPVTVFATSLVTPSNRWGLVLPAGPFLDASITVVPRVGIDTLNHEIPAGTTGRLYFHTSAGIRRYDIDAVPVHQAPSDGQTALAAFRCRQWVHQWTKFQQIKWLVDPPAWDRGIQPLRQWSILVEELPAGDTVTIHTNRNGREYGTPVVFVAPQTGSAAIEMVTDATTEISIEHTAPMTPVARLAQRWLLPTSLSDLGGSVRALKRTGDLVVATIDREIPVNGTTRGSVAANGQAMPPYSIRLRGGKVAAVWNDKLVIAEAWGSY